MFQLKMRKLSVAQVKEIRDRSRDGQTAYKIAKDMNYPASWKAIRRVQLGETYRDVISSLERS